MHGARYSGVARAHAHGRGRYVAGMCMQCVAQSTPMVGVGLTVLRRKSLAAFMKASFARPLALLRR